MIFSVYLEDRYAEHVRARLKRPEHRLWRLKRNFSQWYPLELEEITDEKITDWLHARVREVKPQTANVDLANLRAVMRHAFFDGYLDHEPMKRVRPIRCPAPAINLYLETDPLRALRRQLKNRPAGDQLRTMVLVTLNTGIRWGELASLGWDAIDWRQQLLSVYAEYAKSIRMRHVPINSEAMYELVGWRESTDTGGLGSGLIFPSKRGSSEPMARPPEAWHALRMAIGLPRLRWHDLRHHCASSLAMRGVPIHTIGEILGHADVRTTMRYTHLAESHKRRALEKISGLSRKNHSSGSGKFSSVSK